MKASGRQRGRECAFHLSVLTLVLRGQSPASSLQEVPVCVLALQEVCMAPHTNLLSFPSGGRSCRSVPWTPKAL